jgi:signal peptidase I, bacterial type
MSSDRPGRPADVVPEGEDPRATGSAADTGPIRRPGGRAARRREEAAKKGSLIRELPVLLLIAFVLALLVKTFLVQAFFIPSGSMERTLHGCPGCTGDRVLVNKVPYWFGEPEPGDIVVFEGPESWSPEVDVQEPGNALSSGLLWLGRAIGVAPPSEDDYVKRVIATGGQTVQCCDPRAASPWTANRSTSRTSSRTPRWRAGRSGPSPFRRAGCGSWATTGPRRRTPRRTSATRTPARSPWTTSSAGPR